MPDLTSDGRNGWLVRIWVHDFLDLGIIHWQVTDAACDEISLLVEEVAFQSVHLSLQAEPGLVSLCVGLAFLYV